MDSITFTVPSLPDFATWGFWNWALLYLISAVMIWFPWHFSTLIRARRGAAQSKCQRTLCQRTFLKGKFCGSSLALLVFGPLIFVFAGLGCVLNPTLGVLGLVFLGDYENPFPSCTPKQMVKSWLLEDWRTYSPTYEEKAAWERERQEILRAKRNY